MITTVETETVDAFAERVFGAVLGALEIQAVYLGDRLGWYQALAAHGPLTSVELAQRTGTTERYAREWLEHQAVSGYITTDDVGAEATERRYHLPPAQAEVLADPDSLAYVAPVAVLVAGAGKQLAALREAYRTGGGVSWAQLGEDPREGQAGQNRAMFLHQLGQEFLPAIGDVDTRLRSGGRVADVGCGLGWSSVGIARTYPAATVDGYDVDVPSVDGARRNAAEAGLDDRVSFTVADVATTTPDRPYDAVFAFECVHDMPDPVAVLAGMGRLAGDDGAVIVMDEAVEDEFTAPGDEAERLFYGFSLICCLPDGMSHQRSAATGTVMRVGTLIDYATRAGFSRVDVLPIEHELFRFYRLHR